MANQITFTKELVGARVKVTGVVGSTELPSGLFLYKLKEDGTPGEWQAVANVMELGKYLEFRGKPLTYPGATTGFCRQAKLEVLLPEGADVDEFERRILSGLKNFASAYAASKITTRVVMF